MLGAVHACITLLCLRDCVYAHELTVSCELVCSHSGEVSCVHRRCGSIGNLALDVSVPSRGILPTIRILWILFGELAPCVLAYNQFLQLYCAYSESYIGMWSRSCRSSVPLHSLRSAYTVRLGGLYSRLMWSHMSGRRAFGPLDPTWWYLPAVRNYTEHPLCWLSHTQRSSSTHCIVLLNHR